MSLTTSSTKEISIPTHEVDLAVYVLREAVCGLRVGAAEHVRRELFGVEPHGGDQPRAGLRPNAYTRVGDLSTHGVQLAHAVHGRVRHSLAEQLDHLCEIAAAAIKSNHEKKQQLRW